MTSTAKCSTRALRPCRATSKKFFSLIFFVCDVRFSSNPLILKKNWSHIWSHTELIVAVRPFFIQVSFARGAGVASIATQKTQGIAHGMCIHACVLCVRVMRMREGERDGPNTPWKCPTCNF